MFRSRRSAIALVLAAVLTAALAATFGTRDDDPGVSAAEAPRAAEQDPAALLDEARSALLATENLRLTGSLDEGDVTYKVRTEVNPREGTCSGTFTGGTRQMHFVRVDSTVYLKGNRPFWRANAGEDVTDDEIDATLAFIGQRWVRGDLGPQERVFLDPFCNVDRVLPSSGRASALQFSGRELIGQAVTARRLGFLYLDHQVVLVVADDPPHLPLALELTDRDSGHLFSRLTFDYSGEVTITIPDETDTITRHGPVLGA